MDTVRGRVENDICQRELPVGGKIRIDNIMSKNYCRRRINGDGELMGMVGERVELGGESQFDII